MKRDLLAWGDRIASQTIQSLQRASIHSPFDLLLHLPTGFRDRTHIYSRGSTKELSTVDVQMLSASEVGQGRRHLFCKARRLEDGSPVTIRFFNYNSSMVRWVKGMKEVTIIGEPSRGQELEFVHPRITQRGKEGGKAVVAQYPAVTDVPAGTVRKLMLSVLEDCDFSDTIPEQALRRNGLPTLREALLACHRPAPGEAEKLLAGSHPATMHLKFSEWLAYQLLVRRTYKANKSLQAPVLEEKGIVDRISGNLPFKLTPGQRTVLNAVRKDMASPTPMRRLLHGDVGSGKTIVAGLACAIAADNRMLAVFMAPTELLAEQHYSTLLPILGAADIGCELLTGSVKQSKRRNVLGTIHAVERTVLFGTHALFQEKVELPELGLAVIDEQHRFGVKQRKALVRKGKAPHQLMLSATPIPRTLSLGLFSDLDVSVLDDKPPGRMPVSTQIYRSEKRQKILELIDRKLEGQIYWICPLIRDSEKQDLLSAETLHAIVREQFPGLNAGLIHGQMPAAEKAEILARFKAGEIRMIVATTVVEVGIDAPEADVMVIEHSERMGLSQMHQLRGRVGRGGRPGHCLLLYSGKLSEEAAQRLKVVRETSDGFKVAHADLKMRGFGEWLGLSQSGMKLRFIDPLIDQDLVKAARSTAEAMVADEDPKVETHLKRWLGAGGRKARPG